MKYKDIPGWTFEVQETSANVYKVIGYDSHGRSVEHQGLDPDELLQRSKEDAIKMSKTKPA